MDKQTISLSAGAQTNELVSFIFNNMSDEQVDEIDVERFAAENGGIARELITMSVSLTLATGQLVVVVGRLIEKWLQQRGQAGSLHIVYEALNQNPEGGRVLQELAMKYADVSIRQGLLTPDGNPRGKKGGV